MRRNRYAGLGLLALAGTLGVASILLQKHSVVEAAAVTAPRFEVDPLWPKPLPNHWILGQTIGVSVGRAGSRLDHSSRRLARSGRNARHHEPADRAVLRAGAAGAGVRSGRQPGRATGAARATATTGRIRTTASPSTTKATCGSAATAADRRARAARSTARTKNRPTGASGKARVDSFADNMVLKFTQDGKFLMQIGKPKSSKGSNDIENLRLPAKIFVDPKTNEALRRRRLRQPSRDRVRRRHRQVQAPLGRLRQQARRRPTWAATIPTRRRRSSSATRCTAPSCRTTACSTSATA